MPIGELERPEKEIAERIKTSPTRTEAKTEEEWQKEEKAKGKPIKYSPTRTEAKTEEEWKKLQQKETDIASKIKASPTRVEAEMPKTFEEIQKIEMLFGEAKAKRLTEKGAKIQEEEKKLAKEIEEYKAWTIKESPTMVEAQIIGVEPKPKPKYDTQAKVDTYNKKIEDYNLESARKYEDIKEKISGYEMKTRYFGAEVMELEKYMKRKELAVPAIGYVFPEKQRPWGMEGMVGPRFVREKMKSLRIEGTKFVKGMGTTWRQQFVKPYEKVEAKITPITKKLPEMFPELKRYAEYIKSDKPFLYTSAYGVSKPWEWQLPKKGRERLAYTTMLGAGGYRGIREKPLKTILIGGAAYLASLLGGPKAGAATIKVIPQVIASGLTVGYGKGMEQEFKLEPDWTKRWAKLGERAGTEMLPAILGVKLGTRTKVGKIPKKTVLETKEVYEYHPTQDIKGRTRSTNRLKKVLVKEGMTKAEIKNFMVKHNWGGKDSVLIEIFEPGEILKYGKTGKNIFVSRGKHTHGFMEFPKRDIRMTVKVGPRYTIRKFTQISTGKSIDKPIKTLTLEQKPFKTQYGFKKEDIMDISEPGRRATGKLYETDIMGVRQTRAGRFLRQEATQMYRIQTQQKITTVEHGKQVVKTGRLEYAPGKYKKLDKLTREALKMAGIEDYGTGYKFVVSKTTSVPIKPSRIYYGAEKYPSKEYLLQEGVEWEFAKKIPGKVFTHDVLKTPVGTGKRIIIETVDPWLKHQVSRFSKMTDRALLKGFQIKYPVFQKGITGKGMLQKLVGPDVITPELLIEQKIITSPLKMLKPKPLLKTVPAEVLTKGLPILETETELLTGTILSSLLKTQQQIKLQQQLKLRQSLGLKQDLKLGQYLRTLPALKLRQAQALQMRELQVTKVSPKISQVSKLGLKLDLKTLPALTLPGLLVPPPVPPLPGPPPPPPPPIIDFPKFRFPFPKGKVKKVEGVGVLSWSVLNPIYMPNQKNNFKTILDEAVKTKKGKVFSKLSKMKIEKPVEEKVFFRPISQRIPSQRIARGRTFGPQQTQMTFMQPQRQQPIEFGWQKSQNVMNRMLGHGSTNQQLGNKFFGKSKKTNLKRFI